MGEKWQNPEREWQTRLTPFCKAAFDNRTNWWLLPANSGNSTNFCYVNNNGNANNNNASNTNIRVPV